MKMLRLARLVLPFLAVLLLSLGANVYLHELGHFAVADALELEPEMHVKSPVNFSRSTVFSVSSPEASVTYQSSTPEIEYKDALIASAGPLVNAFLAVFAGFIYLTLPKKSHKATLLFLLFIVPCIASVVVNILPIQPSDGWIIWEYFSQL